MKSSASPRILVLGIASLLAAPLANAATYYWDGNDNGAGFGAASGTWAAPTIGTTTSGWTVNSAGTAAFGNVTTATGDTINFGNGVTGLGAGTIAVSGTVSAGNIIFASGSGNITLSGGTITLVAAQTTTVDNATNTISSNLAGAGTSFTKAGSGTLILSGNNTYAGSTTISGGKLVLDYSTNNTTKLSDTTALILSGGSLDLSGGSHTEVVGSTTLTAATGSYVTRSSVSSILQMGTITNNTGTVNFGASGIATTNNLNNATGILGTWATVGGDWAATAASGTNISITAYTGYVDVARLGTPGAGIRTIADGNTSNVRLTEGSGASGTVTLGNATTTINTLNQSVSGGSSAVTIALANQTLRTNGILMGSGTGNLTIGAAGGTTALSGTLTTATAGGSIIVTNNSSNSITINSVIADNTTNSALIKAGTGVLVLSGASTYKGGTFLLDGTIRAGASGNILGDTINNGLTIANKATAVFDLDGKNVSVKSLAGGGNLGGNVTLGSGTLTLSNVVSANYAGIISGTGNLTSIGSSGWGTTGAHTYTGITTINSGYSTSVLADGGEASGIGASSSAAGNLVITNGTLTYSGTSNASTNRAFTVGAGASFAVSSSGAINWTNTAAITHSTTAAKTLSLGGASTGIGTLAAQITDSGSGSNITSVTKLANSTNNWTLSGTNNTFTGAITLASTTASNGTLAYASASGGNAISFLQTTGSATLSYIGSGNQTMSGLIQANVLTTGTITLDSSGAGAVNYSNSGSLGSAVATGSKGLVLSGTSTGNNTLKGAWVDNAAGGNATIAKTGIGTWVLSGANLNTGATTVSGGGTLVLDYGSQDNSKLADVSSLTFSNGGSNIILRGGSHKEVVSILTVGTGGGNSIISREGGSTATISGAITRASNGGVTLSLAGDGSVTTTSAAVNGILTGGITVGSNWATVSTTLNGDGTRDIVAYPSANYTALTASNSDTTNTGTLNYNLAGGVDRTATLYANSLRIEGSGAADQVLNLGSNRDIRIGLVGLGLGNGAPGGILYAGGGTNNYTITGTGTSRIQALNGNQEVIFNTFDGTLTIEIPVLSAASNTTAPLTKTGVGTLVLKGSSDYAGITNVNQGVLRLANATAAGAASNTVNLGIIVHNGNALELSNSITVGAEALTITGAGISSGGALANFSGNNTYGGAITIGAGGARINAAASSSLALTGGVGTSLLNDVTFGGAGTTTLTTAAISGAGGLIKDGNGTLNLNFANTYTGVTTIKAGTLAFTTGGLGTAGNIAFAGNSTLTWGTSTTTDLSPRLVMSNGVASTLDTGSNTVSFASAIGSSSTGSLTKAGVGTLTLNGVNTYTGNTTISAGTLALSAASTNNIAGSPRIVVGALAGLDVTGLTGGTLTLASGQTLSGNGTVTGGLSFGTGTVLSPGNSPGTLSSVGNVTYASGGTYQWEINNTLGTQGTDPGWDFENITGALNITATSGSTFTIGITGLNVANAVGSVSNWNPNSTYSFVLASASGGISGFSANKFTLQTTSFTSGGNTISGNGFTIAQSGNNLLLNYVGNDSGLTFGGTTLTVRQMVSPAAQTYTSNSTTAISNSGTLAGNFTATPTGNVVLDPANPASIVGGSTGTAFGVGFNNATTGAKSGSVTIANTSNTADTTPPKTLTVSGAVVDNRTISSTTAALGNVFVGTTTAPANATLTSSGSDNNFTRVNVAATGASSGGATVAAGTSTTFNGGGQSETRSVTGNFATSGSKSGTVALTTTGEGLAGESVNTAAVAYSANVFQQASLSTSFSAPTQSTAANLTLTNAASTDSGQRAGVTVNTLTVGNLVSGDNTANFLAASLSGTPVATATTVATAATVGTLGLQSGRLNGTYKASVTGAVGYTDSTLNSQASVANQIWNVTATVTGNTGSGSASLLSGTSYSGYGLGNGVAGSEASLLNGAASSDQVITMSFSATPLYAYRSSNVLTLDGTGNDRFVLELSYDPSLFTGSEQYIGVYNGTKFVNAISINSTPGSLLGGAAQGAYTGQFSLGDYGYNSVTHTAWAVLDRSAGAQLAVIPEPGSLASLLGGLGVLVALQRRRRN